MRKKYFLGAALGLAMSAGLAQAGPITTPPPTLSAIGDVTAVYVFANAGDTSILNEVTPLAIAQIFCNHPTGGCLGSNSGDTMDLGGQNGAMVFSLNNTTAGFTFFSDAADSDGNYHVLISSDYSVFNQGALPSGADTVINSLIASGNSITYIGWEDLTVAAESDFDYNDLIFAFANTVASNNVPEPVSLSLFGAGLAGLTMLRRRKGKAPDIRRR